VQLVTEKTETIKAQINQDAWLTRSVLVQKRECYYRLLKKTDDLIMAVKGARAVAPRPTENIPDEVFGRYVAAMDVVEKHFNKLTGEFHRTALFVGEVAIDVFDDFFQNLIAAATRCRSRAGRIRDVLESRT
jgi:hypothetical protein